MDKEDSDQVDSSNELSSKLPECPHGPMVLFPKYGKNKVVISKFYGCSAYRDKKLCNFVIGESESLSTEKRHLLEDQRKKLSPVINLSKLQVRYKKIKALPEDKRKYCLTCNELFSKMKVHKDHNILENISDQTLLMPTKILQALSNAKTESQYHFTPETTNALLNIIVHNKVNHVLCIGAPSIYENLKSQSKYKHIKSILMDIDHRYHNFFSEDEFIRYNMFNGHFFNNDKSLITFSNFIKNKEVMVIIDPPFGAKFELLGKTLQKIETLHLEQCDTLKYFNVMLVSPYFREKEIITVFPQFHMVDYMVNYVNHKEFQSGGRKQGSPVRIFTSLLPINVPLPKGEGYWFCKICKGWKAQENEHCSICNQCTSKNGATYKHCNKCKVCIKPTWSHCDRCKTCVHPSHEHDGRGAVRDSRSTKFTQVKRRKLK